MSKEKKLAKLIKKLEADFAKLPLAKTASDIVPPEGNPNADLMFIGEAAGFHEHLQRRPFVGAAGKLLTRTLKEVGIEREDVWISNILKVRPPENRDPKPEEIEAFKPFLDEEIRIINPKIIVTLGRFSLAKFIPNAYISRVHGQARWVDWEAGRKLVFPMYHPAAALRNSKVLQEFKQDCTKLVRTLATLNNQITTQGTENSQKEIAPEKEEAQQLELI